MCITVVIVCSCKYSQLKIRGTLATGQPLYCSFTYVVYTWTSNTPVLNESGSPKLSFSFRKKSVKSPAAGLRYIPKSEINYRTLSASLRNHTRLSLNNFIHHARIKEGLLRLNKEYDITEV